LARELAVEEETLAVPVLREVVVIGEAVDRTVHCLAADP